MTLTLELVNEIPAKKPKKIVQSKNTRVQIRFEPQDVDELKTLCFEKGITICDFMRKGSNLLKIYYDQSDTLLSRTEEILPLLNIIRRKR